MIPIKIESRELELLYYNIIEKAELPISVCLTSANKGEGVSVTSYALGRRAAASGHKTLIVDMNTDNPELSELMAFKRSKWHPLDIDLDDAIDDLGNTNLSILSAPNNDTPLWSFREKKSLNKLMTILKEKYDFIVLDIPHIKREEEATIPPETMCSVCDMTLLMVMSGKTKESDVQQTLGVLKKAGVNVSGTIINDLITPTLEHEICRELKRLERAFPRLSKKVRNMIQESGFFSQMI